MISPISAGGGYTRTGICTIVDMDSIEVEVDVNEAFIGRVRAGGAVTAVLDAYPEWTIPASVIAIVPTANREKATVKVRIGFKQKDPRILPDMAHQGDVPGRDRRRHVIGRNLLRALSGEILHWRSHVRHPARSLDRSAQGLQQRQGDDQHFRSARSGDPARRFRRRHGTVRIGQDDAAQPARRHRSRRTPARSRSPDERIDRLSEGDLARWRAANIGFIFQFYNLMPMLSAAQNVELPLLLTNLRAKARRERVADRAQDRRSRRPGEALSA